MEIAALVVVGVIVTLGMLDSERKGSRRSRIALSDRATNHSGSFDDPELRPRVQS